MDFVPSGKLLVIETIFAAVNVPGGRSRASRASWVHSLPSTVLACRSKQSRALRVLFRPTFSADWHGATLRLAGGAGSALFPPRPDDLGRKCLTDVVRLPCRLRRRAGLPAAVVRLLGRRQHAGGCRQGLPHLDSLHFAVGARDHDRWVYDDEGDRVTRES